MNNDIDNGNKPAEEQPPFTNIVSGYLWSINGEPTGHETAIVSKHVRVITSQEIVIELADMADLELNDVARCMAHLGYVCGSVDSKVGWLVHIII